VDLPRGALSWIGEALSSSLTSCKAAVVSKARSAGQAGYLWIVLRMEQREEITIGCSRIIYANGAILIRQ